MSDKYDEVAEKVSCGIRYGDMSHDEIAAILREAYPDHFVDVNKMVKPATCDSCGDPLDVDGDRSYRICAVCAESGCFPGTTRKPAQSLDDLAREQGVKPCDDFSALVVPGIEPDFLEPAQRPEGPYTGDPATCQCEYHRTVRGELADPAQVAPSEEEPDGQC